MGARLRWSWTLFIAAWAAFSSIKPADSQTVGDVVISEIAWMGTQADPNDEWIELYNNTDQAIALTGWKLQAADGTPTIALSGVIPAHGFFLLERTDDSTVNDIIADQIYTGALSNAGEILFLKDPSGNVIDAVNGSGGPWPAGTTAPEATMERLDLIAPDSATNWATNDGIHRNGLDANTTPINGTPKAHKPPYVSITSPTTASPRYAQQGTSLTVSFTTDEAGLYELKLDGTSCGTAFASIGLQNALCTLPSAFSEGAKDLTVTVADHTNTLGSDSEPGAVIVDHTPPTVLLVAPNGGEIIPANTSFTIEWSCSDPHLGAIPIELLYSTDDGATFPNIITLTTENDGAFSWAVPNVTTTARVRVRCTDLANNSATDDSDTGFSIVAFGDVNLDGKINVIDARMAQQHADGVVTLSGMQLLAADVDTDGDVDSADATAIAKKGIGLPTGIVGFALDLPPQPPSLQVGAKNFSPPREGSVAGWPLLVYTMPALLLRRTRRIATLLVTLILVSTLTGCVEFAGLPPPSGPAVYLTSTSMPNGATRTIDIVVQQITSGGGVASLQGRITFPRRVAIQSVTGSSGFVVKALCGTVSEPCSSPNELRFSLVKSSAGGVSSGVLVRLAVSASGALGTVHTLSWAENAPAPIVLGSTANIQITGVTFGDGQVKVH